MHLLLGKQLAQDYSKLFGKSISNRDVKLYSSDSLRSLTSAEAHIIGLLNELKLDGNKLTPTKQEKFEKSDWNQVPPLGDALKVDFINPDNSWNSLIGNTKFFPVRVTNSEDKDFLFLRSPILCPKFQQYFDTERIKYFNQYSNFLEKAGTFKRLNEVFDKEVIEKIDIAMNLYNPSQSWNIENVMGLFKNLWSYRFIHGKDYQPQGTKKELSLELMDELKNIYDGAYHYKKNGDEDRLLPKLQTTEISMKIYKGFLKKIFEEKSEQLSLNQQQNGKNKVNSSKLLIFSGHESTIYPFMYILGLTSPDCHRKAFPKVSTDPKCKSISDYASSLKFELHQILENDPSQQLTEKSYLQKFYVRILYNGTPVNFCPVPSSKYGSYYCRFDIFQEYLGDRFIMDHNLRFCGVQEAKAAES